MKRQALQNCRISGSQFNGWNFGLGKVSDVSKNKPQVITLRATTVKKEVKSNKIKLEIVAKKKIRKRDRWMTVKTTAGGYFPTDLFWEFFKHCIT